MVRNRAWSAVAGLGLAAAGAVAAAVAEEGAKKASIEDLSFMVGNWVHQDDHGAFHETWLPPGGGTMAAVSRQVSGSRTKMLELSSVEPDEKGDLSLLIRHFGTGLVPWKQEAEGAGRWRLVESAKGNAVFESAVHEFPKRIYYRAGKGDTLVAGLEGTQHGKPSGMEFAFTREK